MNGYIRFFLSTLVVLSHLGHPGLINVGVSAVVVFYILSGYVVTHLTTKYFPLSRLKAFYVERFLRIYPTYLVFLLLTSLFLFTTNYASPNFTLTKVLANLTIIPLNYFMFIDVAVVRDLAVLPPAWSLGAEIQAYLLLPLIISRSNIIKWIIGLSSLAIFSISAMEIISPEFWGYRLLPGILFMFLTGAAVCKTVKTPEHADKFDYRFPIVCWVWILFLLIGMVVAHHLDPFSSATTLGFLIGLPIVLFSSKSSVRLSYDSLLGQLSYGLFLIHMPVSWAFEYFFGGAINSKQCFLFVMVVSLLLSAIVNYTIEQEMWQLRKSITKPASPDGNSSSTH